MLTNQIFDIANIFVLPFWGLMIFLPKWRITRIVMGSYIGFIPLAIAYIYLFVNSITPENSQNFSNIQLADVARLFSDENIAATGWVHYLAMDLFVGRYIYLQGQKTGAWTAHSLCLCLFAGPMGLLSHILTHAFVTKKWSSVEVESTTTDTVNQNLSLDKT